MSYEIRFSYLFRKKLRNIREYYNDEFKNESLFKSLEKEILECTELLKLFLNIKTNLMIPNNLNFKKYTLRNHVIVYEVNEEEKIVYITNIYHQLEDYLSHYEEEEKCATLHTFSYKNNTPSRIMSLS